MDEVERRVVRRIAIQMKQRQRRHSAHKPSICELARKGQRRPRAQMKTPPCGGAFLTSFYVSVFAVRRPAGHPVGRPAAAGRASVVRRRPAGRPAADHLAAVGRASGLDFDSFLDFDSLSSLSNIVEEAPAIRLRFLVKDNAWPYHSFPFKSSVKFEEMCLEPGLARQVPSPQRGGATWNAKRHGMLSDMGRYSLLWLLLV